LMNKVPQLWNENSKFHHKVRPSIPITLWNLKELVKFWFFIPELWDFIHQIVGDFSYVKL
jgi:hypothetical protein